MKSKEAFIATAILCILLGTIIGWIITPKEVREVEVMSARKTMKVYIEVMENYYGIEVETNFESIFEKIGTHTEILEFDNFVRFLKINGFDKCYFDYASLKNKAWIWIEHKGNIYYWKLEV